MLRPFAIVTPLEHRPVPPALGLCVLALAGAGSACTPSIDVTVQLIDPCNQSAIDMVDYLHFEPRGTGIDSEGLGTTVDIGPGSAPEIKIPLANDFQLVVEGMKGDPQSSPIAIGVSAKHDLSSSKNAISVSVPFALVDAFYKATDLAPPNDCAALKTGRFGATATYLPSSGRVLIVGGASLSGGTLAYTRTVELYDPSTGVFVEVGEVKTGGARAFHTATLLEDGRVLVAGGEAIVGQVRESLKSALIIDARDPSNVSVEDTGIMRQPRTGHVAVRLSDGRVLLAGGRILVAGAGRADHTYLSSMEIFDPESGSFRTPANGSGQGVELSAARFGHTATMLRTGSDDILIAGGMNSAGPEKSVEVVRIAGSAVNVVRAQSTLGVGPVFHAADIAQDGSVLLSGGYDRAEDAEPSSGSPVNPSQSVEMWEFNASTGDAHPRCTGMMTEARGRHTVSMVGKKALFVGGRGTDGSPLATAELTTLRTGGSCLSGSGASTVHLADARTDHVAVSLEASGEVMVVGGKQQEGSDPFGRSIDSAEIFSPFRTP